MTSTRTPEPQNPPAETGVGSVFVSNYPPYGVWKKEMAP